MTGYLSKEADSISEDANSISEEIPSISEEELMEYKRAVKKYILQCVLMEGSKIIIFFVLFYWLNLTSEFLMALFMLMLVRCNGGGLHCKHYVSCLFLSLFIMAGCIYLGLTLPISPYIAPVILVICGILGYLMVPIVSANRPAPDEKLIRSSKIRTISIIFLYNILICICPYSHYFNIGTWTIIVHILQLLLAKYLQRRRVHYV